MCGICGIVDPYGPDREGLERMTRSLAHRGPDGEGFHFGPAFAFGHRRLSIIDRMTMAHGLEARAPFLDHEIAEFCASLPSSFKIRGTTRRLIQSKLAERYLPVKVLNREKQGFASAFTYMMGEHFDALHETFLAGSRLVEDGYWNAEPIRTLLKEHGARRADHGNRLWLLCNSEVWFRMFVRGESRDALREDMIRSWSDYGIEVPS